jgi:hypothetical protein
VSSDELVKRASVGDLVRAFRESADAVRTAFGMIAEAERRLNATFKLDSHSGVDITPDGERFARFDADAAVERMRRDAWRIIVDRLEIWRVLSNKRADELKKELERGSLPEITEENVEAFARSYMGALPDLLNEMVGEVYEWLRPREGTHRAKYKTNSVFEVGERVILTGMVERAYIGRGFRLHYQRQQILRSLENTFSALDGRGQTGKRYNSLLEDAIGASPDGQGETDYFRFRACKNGNLHVEFRRRDLLARFNQIAGGLRLKPTRSAA